MGEPNSNILVARKEVEWIAYHYMLSEHAKVALIRRDYVGEELKHRILRSPLAWKTYGDRTAVALDLYTYIIVDVKTRASENIATICTFVDMHPRKINVIDKMLISYRDACSNKDFKQKEEE